MEEVIIFWFRRDLRITDNIGFYNALLSGKRILPIFIFDSEILARFPLKKDRRVDYIHQAVSHLDSHFKEFESSLLVLNSTVDEAFNRILNIYNISAVYFNEDYEPETIKRDQSITSFLEKKAIKVFSYSDHVIFRPESILKNDQTPYKVYTPYAKQWRSKLRDNHLVNYSTSLTRNNFYKFTSEVPTLASLGYLKTDILCNPPLISDINIQNYDQIRDLPGLDMTSKLGIALRFGTLSIRECVLHAVKNNEVWLGQLIWREFFIQILYHFPSVEKRCFRSKFEAMPYLNNEEDFSTWCKGETGYPLVDAGIKELLVTGFMHNRVRMVVASFLTKHLLIDWRWGEAFFAQHLNDYELASNNGNWQWVAGSGCDASPYFRIFNPIEQLKKFDSKKEYINKWLPSDYIENPMVDHKEARARALLAYQKITSL